MEVQAPVTMEEAVVEGAATFILLCAGMIITKIVTKFIILQQRNVSQQVR
jgi:hypothetical protein